MQTRFGGVKLTVAYSRAEPQIPYNLDDVKQKVNSIWKDWKNESDNIPAAGSKSEKEKYLKEVLGYLTQEGNGLSRRHISEIKSDEYLEEVYDEDR